MSDATPAAPGVAQVAVDVPLSHLDRPFDYAVPPTMEAEAVPGSRVRVRFAGRLRDGVILARPLVSESDRPLSPLQRVISAEPVLTAEVATLIRRVADHYGGTFADVLRLAVPPRHATTEQAERRPPDALPERPPGHGPYAEYPNGPELMNALAAGRSPRAAWQVVPSASAIGDWAEGFAVAARACVDSGRGAVLVAPDRRDVERLAQACRRTLGPAGFAILTAEQGPAARYRAFLAALRGDVAVVIGNRAASYAPVADLGLVALWDDGDDLLAERRAPYPHVREVLALRAGLSHAAALFASYGRSCEIQALLDRGWLRELAADRGVVRHAAPRVRVADDSVYAMARDPAARTARLPHDVFELMRATLPQGPVLVQVPRAGYLVALVCAECREPARCRTCHGPLRVEAPRAPGAEPSRDCGWCGRPQTEWECEICGSATVRAPSVGAERTAEELGKAFPNTPVKRSVGGRRASRISPEPAIVVATPGAEPQAEAGYAGAVLLDADALLLRPDLRASEEALRRWLNAVALVRGGADGGSVIVVGESSSRALQALVRLDPRGFAHRELQDRADAHFPPAAKVVAVDGESEALAEFSELARLPASAEQLGPVDLPAAEGTELLLQRLTLRCPPADGAALVRAAKDVLAIRSARKRDRTLRIAVDPVAIG